MHVLESGKVVCFGTEGKEEDQAGGDRERFFANGLEVYEEEDEWFYSSDDDEELDEEDMD